MSIPRAFLFRIVAPSTDEAGRVLLIGEYTLAPLKHKAPAASSRLREPRGSTFEDDVDPAVVNRRIARSSLAYRLLPDHRPRNAVLLELVGDNRAARLREIFVGLRSASGARACLDDDSLSTSVPRPLCGIGDRRLCFIGQVRAEFVKIHQEPRDLGDRGSRRRLRAR